MSGAAIPVNKKISSIERVGDDGFIVESADPTDPAFSGGKKLIPDFDSLIRFLARQFEIYKASGATYGMREEEHNGRPG